MRKIFVCWLLLLPIACAEVDYAAMKSSEQKSNKRAQTVLLIYMSLEQMFPDKNARNLADAAANGDISDIENLLKKGMDVNSRGTKNATPLFWAMRDKNGFEYLLQNGADPNIVFDDGGSVMHWAASHKGSDLLRLALKYKGNPNLKAGPLVEIPIFDAIGLNSHKDNLGLLLDAGADIDSQSINGNTILLVAAGRGRFDLVYELLERGANYKIKNNNGYDLADRTAAKKKIMDPDHELAKWMRKVIAWLNNHGIKVE